jgi:hypothetical protein
LHAIALGIDAGLGQQTHERGVRSRSGADAEALHGAHVAARGGNISAQHQQPRRPLGHRDRQLCPREARKGGERGVGARHHEVHLTVPQRRHGPRGRRQQLDPAVEPFGTVEAKLLAGEGGEVGIRNEVGHGDAGDCAHVR